jgi:hypothetical protein
VIHHQDPASIIDRQGIKHWPGANKRHLPPVTLPQQEGPGVQNAFPDLDQDQHNGFAFLELDDVQVIDQTAASS